MRGNPFLNFHRTAEAAGFPALLLVSMFCLGLVVTPVILLGLTRAVWVLVIAVLSVIGAIAVLAGEVAAAFADDERLRAGHNRAGAAVLPDDTDSADPAPRPEPSAREAGDERKAA
jgi:hypothetical protein